MKSLDECKEQKYYGNLTTTRRKKETKKDKMTGRKMTGRKNDKEGTIEEIRKKGNEMNT